MFLIASWQQDDLKPINSSFFLQTSHTLLLQLLPCYRYHMCIIRAIWSSEKKKKTKTHLVRNCFRSLLSDVLRLREKSHLPREHLKSSFKNSQPFPSLLVCSPADDHSFLVRPINIPQPLDIRPRIWSFCRHHRYNTCFICLPFPILMLLSSSANRNSSVQPARNVCRLAGWSKHYVVITDPLIALGINKAEATGRSIFIASFIRYCSIFLYFEIASDFWTSSKLIGHWNSRDY